jgi:uncharacterized protein DUF4331
MKRLALVAALAAIAVAVPLGFGSSHREAPLTALDPTADDTDIYAFTAKNDPATARNEEDQLTVVANWIPFEDPAGGPNFYRFDDRAHYYINVDNDGDGRYDVRYLFKFKTHYNNPNSFLYAAPQVTSLDDPQLFVTQTYDVYRIGDYEARSSSKKKAHRRSARRHHRRGKHRHARRSRASVVRIANDYPVAPNNIGPKTMPDYDALAREAIKDLPGGGRVFVGQRDDPFFVDLGATFDGINIDPKPLGRGTIPGNNGGGKDDLSGYSVHSIVLQVPEQAVTKDGEKADKPKRKHDDDDDDDAKASANAVNDVVGVWASTERRKLQVVDSGDDEGKADWVQVSRLGNPLVNEVVIPLGLKDKFNRTSPADDATNFGKFVVEPELAKLMNALFSLGVKETDRTDIVLALLQGVPGLNRQSDKPVDTLKINLATPPSTTENRLGVLGGDLAGFPNGRRLADDVTDIELRVVAGALLDPPNNVPLGDGVDTNDKPFTSSFPYLASPTSGFDAKLKREDVPPAP